MWFNHLRKLRELFIRQHGDVAEQFMAAVPVGAGRTGSEPQAADGMSDPNGAEGDDHSRLGGVHGGRRMPDVLRALKHPEGQAGQEISG